MSGAPGNGHGIEAPPDTLAFSDATGELAGVMIAAGPGSDHAGSLPLVAFALGAEHARLLAAAGEQVALEVSHDGRSSRWAARGAGITTELEVTPTDDDGAVSTTAASHSCRVGGQLSGPDGARAVQGAGLLGGGPVLDGPATLARWLAALLSNGRTVTLNARRPRRGSSHASEEVTAWVRDEAGSVLRTVAQPLLSTTYDDAGHARHAGLELWMDEEAEFPRRAAGEARVATTVRAGGVCWEVSFLAWTMEGQVGEGPYVIAHREG